MSIHVENYPDHAPEEEPSIDLRQYVALFRQWWWLIGLASLLAGAAAYLYSRQLTPTYAAATTLLVNEAASASTADYSSLMTNQMLAQTYAQILTARPVMEKVATRLGIHLAPESLAGMVTVTPLRDTQLLVVRVESEDAELSAALANGVAQVFAEQVQATQRARFAASEDNLQAQLADAQGQIDRLHTALASAKDPAERDRLEARLNQYEQIAANLVVSYEQVRTTAAQSATSVEQVESAIVNPQPVKPNKLRNTLLAAVVGLLLSVGGVVAYDTLDDTVKSPEVVQRTFQLPVMGAIARFAPPPDGRLISQAQPRSPVTEAFRALRTNIQYAGVDHPLRTLLVTSPTPADGKTTIAANLAVVLAQSGKRVTVMDADLHQPRMHAVLKVDLRPGLSGLFVRPSAHLNGTFQPTGQELLHVVSAGELPPNPAELLGSQKMREILDLVLAKADLVLLDTPPVLSVTDAVVLAPLVDGVLLVVRPGVTKMAMLKHAIEQLRYVGANLIGVVINGVDDRNARYGYYYRYYKGYYTKSYKSSSRSARSGSGAKPAPKAEKEVAGRLLDKHEIN